MRIDAHHHFWRYDPNVHTWMSGPYMVLARDYLPDELEPLLKRVELDGSIVIQAAQNIDETRWLCGLAEKHPFLKGVVGWVDLCSPVVEKQLDAVSHDKLRGIRHLLELEADEQFMLREDFQNGIRRLGQRMLSFDFLIQPRHLRTAAELARKFPEQIFVVDHLAKPPVAEGRLTPWREHLGILSQCDNVYCKASGMVTEADWSAWDKADYAAYLDTTLEIFGPQRMMIGSDWPVCTCAASYEATMQIIVDYVSRLSPDEQQWLWGRTCTKAYGLECGR